MVDIDAQQVISALGMRIAQLTVDLAVRDAEVRALQALSGADGDSSPEQP